jgi:release factor glutamine methyltransferase
VAGESADVVVSNPPYVPAPARDVPDRGPGRAWDAGNDGRAVLDRLCAEAPKLLAPGGALLLVHSALAGVAQTLHQLSGDGLDAHVVASCSHRFGPVLAARAEYLETRGLIDPGQRWEELVVIRATRRPLDGRTVPTGTARNP